MPAVTFIGVQVGGGTKRLVSTLEKKRNTNNNMRNKSKWVPTHLLLEHQELVLGQITLFTPCV